MPQSPKLLGLPDSGTDLSPFLIYDPVPEEEELPTYPSPTKRASHSSWETDYRQQCSGARQLVGAASLCLTHLFCQPELRCPNPGWIKCHQLPLAALYLDNHPEMHIDAEEVASSKLSGNNYVFHCQGSIKWFGLRKLGIVKWGWDVLWSSFRGYCFINKWTCHLSHQRELMPSRLFFLFCSGFIKMNFQCSEIPWISS